MSIKEFYDRFVYPIPFWFTVPFRALYVLYRERNRKK